MDKALRLTLIGLFITSVCYAAPTTSISIPNSFTPNTTIQSGQVNANNNEISSKYNAHSHTDLTQVGTITSGAWAGTVVAPQFGGTGQDFSGVASGALIYFNGTGTMSTIAKPASGSILYLNGSTQTWSAIPQGASGTILTSAGVGANPSFLAGNRLVQRVYTETGAYATGSTAIPYDDSIPQISDGDEYMSLNITPRSSSNKIKVDVVACISGPTGNYAVALFNNNGPDAIACSPVTLGNSYQSTVMFSHFITSPTAASQTTLKVRIGGDTGTLYFNGLAGGKYGGALASSITATEYTP